MSKASHRNIIRHVFISLALFSSMIRAQVPNELPAIASSNGVEWKSTSAQHEYGLPDTKPNQMGTLTLDASSLAFTSKSSSTTIPRVSITAMSVGKEQVELWGTTGRIMRMAIPDGGGMAVAAVMHRRVDMLTVEFRSKDNGIHSAVFFLPAKEADRALTIVTSEPTRLADVHLENCGTSPIDPSSVLLETPNWENAEVPAAYRALVYEHIVDRLRDTKQVGHVYRAGERAHNGLCPQYTIRITLEKYKRGNQVVRAATGPIGMFTSPTQMTLAVVYSDSATGLSKTEEIKASVRTEAESTSVADAIAKKLAKQYSAVLRTTFVSLSAAPTATQIAHSER